MARQTATTATTTATLPPRSATTTRLRIAIVERGYQQADIAKHLRISPSRMSRIVCGRQEPTDDEQDRLAELLDQPRRKLFRVVA